MRRIVRFFLSVPVLRILILKVPVLRRVYPPWWKTHPIDVQYGIDTSGSVAVDRISSDKKLVSLICPYLGSQPSIVRAALSELTDCENHTFIDLGCGKGRALIVASEFPFRSILGVELSPTLAAIARTNIAKVASRFPFRSRAMITVGNVTEFPLPPGKLAVFNYHAFGPEIVKQVVERLEAALLPKPFTCFSSTTIRCITKFSTCRPPLHGITSGQYPVMSRRSVSGQAWLKRLQSGKAFAEQFRRRTRECSQCCSAHPNIIENLKVLLNSSAHFCAVRR